MPDWRQEIRRRLAGLRLEPSREDEIVEELSQHLDDCYAERLSAGATDEAACRAALAAELGSIAALRGVLRLARVLAAWTFLLLFVAGPVLTATLGTDPAVLCVAALLYPTVLAAIGMLWWRRRAWGLGRGAAALLSVEILVCPAFLPNLVRKITAAHAVDVDGAQLVVAGAPAEAKQEFLGRVATRAEVLINEAADDAEGQAALRSYLAVVRAAQ